MTGEQKRDALAAAWPGFPQRKLGDRVWFGGREYPSGWGFVTDIMIRPDILEDENGEPFVSRCVWDYKIAFEKSGKDWGWYAEKDLHDAEPL
jgi:hypothetical protein